MLVEMLFKIKRRAMTIMQEKSGFLGNKALVRAFLPREISVVSSSNLKMAFMWRDKSDLQRD